MSRMKAKAPVDDASLCHEAVYGKRNAQGTIIFLVWFLAAFLFCLLLCIKVECSCVPLLTAMLISIAIFHQISCGIYVYSTEKPVEYGVCTGSSLYKLLLAPCIVWFPMIQKLMFLL